MTTFIANGPNGVNVGAVVNKSELDIVCLLIIVVQLFLKRSAVAEEVSVFTTMSPRQPRTKIFHQGEEAVPLSSECSIIYKVMSIRNGLSGRPVLMPVEPVGRVPVR